MRRLIAAVRESLARVESSFRRLRLPDDVVSEVPDTWAPPDRIKILWFIQTYRDFPQLRLTLRKLRALYPDSAILVMSDGDPDPRLPQLCTTHSARFAMRQRLFGVEHGGEPVQRMLEALLETDADLLIKIDPDTDVRRRFSRLPPADDRSLYGTVQSVRAAAAPFVSIQGGCIIVPREAAAVLAGSGLLRSGRLKPPALEWAIGPAERARAASGLTSYDWTLGWACRELGIDSRDHPEVFSRYLPTLIDRLADRRVAVAHPRFSIRQMTKPGFYFGSLWAAVRDAPER